MRQARDADLEATPPKSVHKQRVMAALAIATAALENCDTNAIDLDPTTAGAAQTELNKRREEYQKDSLRPFDNSVVHLQAITDQAIRRKVIFATPLEIPDFPAAA